MNGPSPQAYPQSPADSRRGPSQGPLAGRLDQPVTFESGADGAPASEASSTSAQLQALPRYPSLLQINTRVWLTELSDGLGRRATLDDVPDAELDRLAATGFDWIWLLSVWQTGAAGRQVSCKNLEWRREFQETLPDLCEEDIAGSGFAITGYTVHTQLGGDEALARLRERLRQRGLRLLLDFVPNHTGLDHPWVETHPEYYVEGTELDLARAPGNYTWVKRKQGDRLLAYGRDPYFPGWPDALQLNYGKPATHEAMIGELLKIAGQCDGVRCDMAMLVLPEVFERTWGITAPPFWPEATRRVRAEASHFCFMAEVYWDLEWTLQQQGFDYTYDKRLYDRLRDLHARPVREHFCAGLDYQDRLARFLENHDEPRAAAVFALEIQRAAAVITFLSPGLRFFQRGQFQGFRKRISPHLGRGPDELVDPDVESFYERLLGVLRQPTVRAGHWQLLECVPAWEGNGTWDCFVAFAWQGPENERLIVAVNYAPNPSQCYLRLPFGELSGGSWRLVDQLGDATYDRVGDDLASRGLYLDMAPWQAHAFSLNRLDGGGHS
jgi:glycosidase